MVTSHDAGRTLDAARAMLERDPVANNVVLTLLQQASLSPVEGTFWLVGDDDDVSQAAALRWPAFMPAAITPVPPGCVGALVDAVARAAPDLRGVVGEARSAAAFAGAWVDARHEGAVPVEGQRLHRLATVPAPPSVDGALRAATLDDVGFLRRWCDEFAAETGSHGSAAPVVKDRVRRGEIWVWDAGRPAAMAVATGPAAGVTRVGQVYTPPERRRRGYAGACVAALSAQMLRSGTDACVLYTQLSNPVSSSVYRKVGYEPVSDVLRYEILRS